MAIISGKANDIAAPSRAVVVRVRSVRATAAWSVTSTEYDMVV